MEILKYVNDNELSLTEKPLDDDEIVQMVLDEANNVNNESEDDIGELKVIATNEDALRAVDTLIEYFEHQNNLEFNENDYKNLKKYKKSIERKIFFSKTQRSLESFYNI